MTRCWTGSVRWPGRLERASVDTMSMRPAREDHVGPNPVDCGKPGSKLPLVTDTNGLPLAVAISAANIPMGCC
jgi:hypothetical protein